MSKPEQLLLFLLIFLIPSNLAYHLPDVALAKAGFNTPSALVDGILVDYLIPKLYLTDILIISLLAIWLARVVSNLSNLSNLRGKRQTLAKKLKSLNLSRSSPESILYSLFSILYSPGGLLVAFFALTLIRIPSTTSPAASLYFWLKLLELTLFIWYLKSKPLLASRYWLVAALSASVLWQSLLAISQWLLQRNVFPYWFLGESQFSSLTPGIAKASFAGTLKVLPMGTTPHPNVLAGFIAVSLVIIWVLDRHLRSGNAKSSVPGTVSRTVATRGNRFSWSTISKYIITIFGLFTLLLTQSLIAITIFILVSLFISLSHNSSTRHHQVTKIVISLGFVLLIIWSTVTNTPNLESTSLSRRHSLNQIAFLMFKDHPLTGVGLNNFTAVMKNYGDIEATYRFFQPVHNIYLLVLAETGLIGFALVALTLWKLTRPLNFLERACHPVRFWRDVTSQKVTGSFRLVIPVAMILIIGLVDHYPLTLQTGQLMLALAVGLTLSRILPAKEK